MALAEGWEPASARILFNGAGNGCFPNQTFKSREIPIWWTGFMVSFPWEDEEGKENGQNVIPWRHHSPGAHFLMGTEVVCGAGWEVICSKHKVFLPVQKYFDLWDFEYKIQFRHCPSQDVFASTSSSALWVRSVAPRPPAHLLLCHILINGFPCCLGLPSCLLDDGRGYCSAHPYSAGPRDCCIMNKGTKITIAIVGLVQCRWWHLEPRQIKLVMGHSCLHMTNLYHRLASSEGWVFCMSGSTVVPFSPCVLALVDSCSCLLQWCG